VINLPSEWVNHLLNHLLVLRKTFFPQKPIAWRNWSGTEIKKALPLLLSEDIDTLLRYSKKENK
jgi:hypothetical protein